MEDFLKKYSNLPKGFIKDFYSIVNEDYDDKSFCIDFETVIKWLGSRKDNMKKVLKKNFSVNYDYTLETLKIIKKDGGATRKELIKLTPECFKSLCMLSQTEKAKEVRKYFLEMEKLVRQYHKEIQDKIKRELELVRKNQKPTIKEQPQVKGKVYVFEAQNTELTLYKLGRSDDIIKRFGTYNSGNANDIKPLLELEVNDINVVENCMKRSLKKFQYRKYKEVYETSLEVMELMMNECGTFATAMEKVYELHKKSVKDGIQRLKTTENKVFVYISKN